MTLEESYTLINFLNMYYAGFKPTNQKEYTLMAKAWQLALGDVEYRKLEEAVVYLVNVLKFKPVPADIREALKHIGQLNIPTPTEAWAEVVAKANPYQAVKWSNNLIAKAVKIIGYRNICVSENQAVERAHFLKIYQALLDRSYDQLLAKNIAHSVENFLAERKAREQKQLEKGAAK